MKTRFCAALGSDTSVQQKSTGVLVLKSVFLIFVFYFFMGLSLQASPCTQKSIITIDPCHGGGSGSDDDWAGGNDFETFPVFGERIGPGTGESRGGGPNLGNLGSLGRGPGDRGEPGGANWSGGKEDKPKEDEKPRKRNCVLFDGVFHKGQILGVSTKSCSSVSSYSSESGSEPQSVEFALETYSETTRRVATDITNKTIQSMAPEYSNFSELTQEINANLTGISEAAIGEFLNQTMAQMSVNLSLASIDVGADFQNKMKNYLLDQVNFEVQRIGGGPSLFILNQGSSSQNFFQDGTTSFASPHGDFREKVKDLSARLDEINPQDLRQTQAKDLARTTLKIADEENYLGNDDVADQAFDMATELTDFAAGFIPGLSTAKDAYELFTGVNPITGKTLSTDERVFAGLGLLSLGTLSWFKFAPKMIKRFLKARNQESLWSSLSNLKKSLLKDIPIENGQAFLKKILNSTRELVQEKTSGGMSFFLSKFKAFSKNNTSNIEDAWIRFSSTLQYAAKGKGNFGLGKANMSEAMELGEAWVGHGYKIASDGKTLLSKNGLRQFRPPTKKPRIGKTQANFEWRNSNTDSELYGKKWQGNGHLDIID